MGCDRITEDKGGYNQAMREDEGDAMRAKTLRFRDGDRKVRVTFADEGGRHRANAFWGWGSESDVAFLTETGPTKDVAAKRMTETLKVKGFELERKAKK